MVATPSTIMVCCHFYGWSQEEGGKVVVTCCFFAKLMMSLDASADRTRNSLPGNISMIWRAVMHAYCGPNVVNESTCKIQSPFVLTKTCLPNIGCSVVAFAMRTTRSCSSVLTASTLPLVKLVVYVVV